MTDFDEFREVILKETENVVYLSDPVTYEIVYLNQLLKDIYHIQDDNEYKGQKCYKLLQGKDYPCEFCTNKYLTLNQFYTWDRYNDFVNKYYNVRDKLIQTKDERILRLEIAIDITKEVQEKQQLHTKVTSEETLIHCIQTLAENNDFYNAINKILSLIAEFYGAHRVYIFEYDLLKKQASNTYEWCNEEVTPHISLLQNIPLSVINEKLAEYKKTKCLNFLSSHITSYQSLIAPLIEDSQIAGFIGVDHPTFHNNDLDLLTSITYFVVNDIQKRKMMSQLEYLSYTDLLTGLFNRNKYIKDLEMFDNQEFSSLGIIYIDIDGLKKFNDHYGHRYGDQLIRDVGHILNHYFYNQAYRIGGDEFIVICPHMKQKDFMNQVEKMQENYHQHKYISVSIGSVWSDSNTSIHQLIEKADSKMYQEKRIYYKKLNDSRK